MPYTISVFQNWQSFGNWNELKAWLTSAEGGFLRVVEPKEGSFALVRYVKGKSNFALPHVRWCRSVVVEKDMRLPVSVAPPKASDFAEGTCDQATVAEELVDGTMMNAFICGAYDVHLATRSRLNATTKFYENGPSFASMLDDALAATKVPSLSSILPECKDSICRFTSIVLQHPANRIVQKVSAPAFYIVHQGSVTTDGTVTIEEDSSLFRCESSLEDSSFFQIQPYILDSVKGARTVQTWVAEKAQKHGFEWQGLVLKDGQGNRWRQRSEIYETVRQIRGNESAIEERFARLRKARTLDQYSAFFPEDRELLYTLEGRLRKNTRQLFQFYMDVFRARKTSFHALPWPYKHHVSVLHNYFKDTLRAKGQKVTFDEVVKYVNRLNQEDIGNMSKVHKLELKPLTADTPAPASDTPAPTPAPADAAPVEPVVQEVVASA